MDLHRLPLHIAAQYDGKKCIVFCVWPCDPNGKPILPNESLHRKEASNSIWNWSATLYDFYHVTSSLVCMVHWVLCLGVKLQQLCVVWVSLMWQLEWADHEEDPHEILITDMHELITSHNIL
ncbi:hypothetical protein J3A83DRAFT_4084786, partial [Scleroderma citrinum]